MSNNAVSVQAVRSPVQIDPATHLECLEFIRAAISEADREFAQQIAAILKDVCQRGYADRAAIWSELTDIERQQFQELLGPPPLVREFAQRIRDAIGYQSHAVASAIERELSEAIDAGKFTAADVLAVVGETEFTRFKRIAE
jgi:hypothetical protein